MFFRLGVLALTFSIFSVRRMTPAQVAAAPEQDPPASEFRRQVGGVGMVEPASENISIMVKGSLPAGPRQWVVPLEEAEDAIATYWAEQARLERPGEASAAAQSALKLSDVYRAGLADFLGVLDARRSVLEVHQAVAQAHTSALVQSVLLFKALAGGWPAGSNR